MSDTDKHPPPDEGLPSLDEQDAAGDAEPKGTPTSDRHHAERSSHEQGGDAAIPKHDHGPPT